MNYRYPRPGFIPATAALTAAGLVLLRFAPIWHVRRFTRRGFLVGAAGATTTVALAACGPNKGKSGGKGDVTIPKADIPAVNAVPYTSNDGGFYIVHLADGVMALSWTCTHQGCKVPWQSGEKDFHCPCHGSRFAYNGTVTHGPAGRPLDYFPVKVDNNGDLVVNTDKKTERKDFEKNQVLPYPV